MSFVHFSNKRRFEQITDVFYEKCVLRNVTKFTWKHLCWSLFFNKVPGLRPENLLKRESNTGVFWWILRNFLRTLFLQKPSGGCFFKTWKIEVLILNEKISIFWTTWAASMKFSGKTWLNIKSHKKTRLHPLSRIYKFGTSYNYCKNLKWKKPFQDFRFFDFGCRAKFLSQFIFVVSEY